VRERVPSPGGFRRPPVARRRSAEPSTPSRAHFQSTPVLSPQPPRGGYDGRPVRLTEARDLAILRSSFAVLASYRTSR
jgi:hypothetical protein